MQSLFYKMGFALVALMSWVVYDRWDDWSTQASIATEVVSTKVETVVKSSLPTEPPEVAKTTVVKWQDAQGRWHFGDAAPAGVKQAKKEIYSNNVNVMPRVSAEEVAVLLKKDRKENAPTTNSVLNGYVNGVSQARSAQDALNNHAAQTQNRLDNLQ